MSNCVKGGAPWLSINDNTCCTVVEGAEVVRTAAVSYAAPILHQVFIKGSSPPYRTVVSSSLQNSSNNCKNHFATNASKEHEDKKISFTGSTCFSPSLVSTSDGLPNNRSMYRKKVEVQQDQSNSEISLHSSSSIKLPSSFISSSPLKSASQSSETVLSCQSVWSSSASPSSSSSSSSSPLSLSPPKVVSSSSSNPSITNVLLSTAVTLSSPPSPQAFIFSSSPPLPPLRPDDELTSLSWLQDSNLLKGTTLTSIKTNGAASSLTNAYAEKKRLRPNKKEKTESTEVTNAKLSKLFKSDVEDDSKLDSSGSDGADEPNGDLDRLEACKNVSHQPVPYNPKVHTMAKPPFSFSCLIFMAIEESTSKALPVKDIYTWIVDHYPYYKSAPTGWKNSVRHNLSLNKCFSKVEKAPSLGKGSLWMVDPNHRPNLLQAMSKAPFSSVSPLDRTYTLSSKSVINSEWQYNITQKTQETDGKFSLRDLAHKSVEESLNMSLDGSEILCSPTYRKSTSSPKLRIPTRQYHRNASQDISHRKLNHAIHCNDDNGHEFVSNNNNNNNINNNISVPNPELFPRLSKRLELNSLYESHVNAGSYAIDVQIEDVDAATAMLVLKHGPRMLSPLSETCNPLRKNQNSSTNSFPTGEKRKRDKHVECNADDPRMMYISSSPSIDHSYVSPPEVVCFNENIHCDMKQMFVEKYPSSQSLDRACDDQYIKSLTSERCYSERPLEEANALLNLASIATSLASRMDENICRSPVRVPYSNETHSMSTETQSETHSKNASKNNLINKLKSEFAITVNSRSSRKLYKPMAKTFSLALDGELKAKASKVAKLSNSVIKSRCNNNSKDVVNRNKFLKVKKLCLRRHKAC